MNPEDRKAGKNMVYRPDANPILALVVSIVLPSPMGFGPVYNGQLSKWCVIMLVEFIGYLLCVLPGVFIRVLSIIDTYQTAVRLKAGESIYENEYSMPLLHKIVQIIDKSATCAREAVDKPNADSGEVAETPSESSGE
jgi:hypothetical protein